MKTEDFFLDSSSQLPVYIQLREQILRALGTGVLQEGDQLPTVRQIAIHLGVNPNTVNRAYIDLERDGTLNTARGRGTFVARRDATPDSELQQARLRDIARRALGEARSLGFAGPELIAAYTAILKQDR